jgi:hypothetical protein
MDLKECKNIVDPEIGVLASGCVVDPVAASVLQLWWQMIADMLRTDILALRSIIWKIADISPQLVPHDIEAVVA